MPSRGVAESDFDMCYWVVSVSIQVVMYQNASFSTFTSTGVFMIFLLLIWYKELFFSFAFLGLVVRLCIWGSMTGWLFRVLTVRIFLLVRSIPNSVLSAWRTFHITDHLRRLWASCPSSLETYQLSEVKTWFGLQAGPSSHLLAESES